MLIGICDDELCCVEEIKEKIMNLDAQNLEIEIDCFVNQYELLESAVEKKYNLIYLDIEMEGENGIKIAKTLKKNNPTCIIIFVTNYDQYVSSAFRIEAFQYLKKPIDDKVFQEEFERAVEEYKRLNKVKIFKVKDGKRAFHLDEIITIESYYNSTLIKTTRGIYSTNYANLRKIKKELEGYDFLQLQSGYIVNMHYIATVKYREAILITGQTVPISLHGYKKITEKYYEFLESKKQ